MCDVSIDYITGYVSLLVQFQQRPWSQPTATLKPFNTSKYVEVSVDIMAGTNKSKYGKHCNDKAACSFLIISLVNADIGDADYLKMSLMGLNNLSTD